MDGVRRILCIGSAESMPNGVGNGVATDALSSPGLLDSLTSHSNVQSQDVQHVWVTSVTDAFNQLAEMPFEGIWIDPSYLPHSGQLAGLLHSSQMLRDIPEGVAMLDDRNQVIWANRRLLKWANRDSIALGTTFYELLDNPEIMGPDFCPFHTALATGNEGSSTLHRSDNRYFQIHAAPINDLDSQSDRDPSTAAPRQLIVTVSDITEEILQQQKIAAIHKAGRELADLRPREIFMMEVDERIELLKENIRHYLKDLLSFEVIEIRLLEQATATWFHC